jgi:hypothetical protein
MKTELKTPLSPEIVKAFCGQCDRAHELWLHHRALFDHNPRAEEIMESFAREEFVRLSVISQEYSLLQIRKLHDPDIMKGHATLGIKYMVNQGRWSDAASDTLHSLAEKLDRFAEKLDGVRNKLLSHNDLKIILEEATLGEFIDGEDAAYFDALQEFVNIVHREIVGDIYPFATFVVGDVHIFLESFQPRPNPAMRPLPPEGPTRQV